jgi:site-specific recombinase XerD
MFDQLFRIPWVVARQRNGPLAEERLRYLTHCAEQQMSRRTLRSIARYTLLAAELLCLAKRRRRVVSRGEVEAEVDGWLARRSRRSTARQIRLLGVDFKGHVIRWLVFLGRLQPAAKVRQPYAAHIAQFLDSARERNLSPQTIGNYERVLRRFLPKIEEAGLRLQTLTVVQLDELVIQKVREGRCARNTIQTGASVLRVFFRFAEERGWCRKGLAAAIMVPHVYTHEGLPIGPSWDDVKRLLVATERGQATERDRTSNIRDRALLMLLAVYGLRAGEVVSLRLEDFDWEREVLCIPHGKSQRSRTYPLCRSVGDAVLRYLREVRPRSDQRQMFLTLVPPFRPLAASNLGAVVCRRLHALGLTLPHYGSHVLRHACAAHLLAQGFSLKEIGDHLGHRSSDATRIYAKVDLAALRAVGDFALEGLL